MDVGLIAAARIARVGKITSAFGKGVGNLSSSARRSFNNIRQTVTKGYRSARLFRDKAAFASIDKFRLTKKVADSNGVRIQAVAVTCAPKLPPFSGRVSNNYGDRYEAITLFRRTDYCDIKGAGERLAD